MIQSTTQDPIRLGISGCLLGDKVRFDGGHSRDRFVTEELSRWVEYVPVCPEVEMGMGTPRPAIRLVDEGAGLRLVCPSTGEDFTDRMETFATQRVAQLREANLDGYILKRRSPSCGMARLPIYRNQARLSSRGVGQFAKALMDAWPTLPIEEDGRLNDPGLRENFIERIFGRHRWRRLSEQGLTRGGLVDFHTRHKMLLLAHHPEGYRQLGRLVASLNRDNEKAVFAAYENTFQACLANRASVRGHANVLQHAMGYLKRHLSRGERRSLHTCIQDFRLGLLPLIVPLELLRFNVERHGITYLANQLYLAPRPKALKLHQRC